jgi:prophage tail gpP-like protein
MSLAPSLSVTLGNLRYDTHALAMEACLALLPRGSSFEVRLPANARFEAAPGDDAELKADGGEGSELVLKGKVQRVQRDVRGINVIAADAAADLATFRPTATYEKQSAADVIRALAGEVQASVSDMDLDLPLPAYVAVPARTAAEQIAELARLGGCIARVDAEGRLSVIARPTEATVALKYAREFLDYRVTENPSRNPRRFAVGFGPAGSASAPNALRQTTDFLPSTSADGGVDVLRPSFAMLRTPGAASDASTALQTAAAARTKRLRATCFLLPTLQPGAVIEVQELPDGLNEGPWLVTCVVHRLRPASGGATVIQAESADTSSLLGSLLSAIGGLL